MDTEAVLRASSYTDPLRHFLEHGVCHLPSETTVSGGREMSSVCVVVVEM